MKKYRKLFISIGLSVIAFILNSILFNYMRLEQPIFLKHYYEIQLEEGSGFNIYCIMNNEDDKEVVRLEFPELNSDEHVFKVNKGNSFSLNSHHDQKEYWIDYHYMGTSDPLLEEIHLKEARITFNNGEKSNIPIGEIVFYSPQRGIENRRPLKYTFSRASSLGEITSQATITEDVEVLEGKSTLDYLVNDLIELKINGEAPSHKNLKKDMPWILEGKLEVKEGDSRRFNAYDIQTRIYFRRLSGEIVVEPIFNLKYSPYFTMMESYKYIKKLGGI
nr:hypothetical protein [uncultured Niameybacter sp.]